ncbi:LOW QUALITY PROTEIN: PHD finger protein 14 [Ostrinia nubilalis]|uniref:LOW QUALITY PROTEIN: PHD finger protein 14 n=1 Tax=Ostrinia nubilalis TaxID=29057 RepID=UPI00308267BA
MSTQGRGAAKRKVKPVEPQSLLDFDLAEGESSDDSDFRIEDHPEESDDYSINSDDDDKKKDGSSSEEQSESDGEDGPKSSNNKIGEEISVTDILEKAKQQEFKIPFELANMLICAGCLGSRSDCYNEIVECDGCGVTVHEGCYGVSDVTSESSTVSSASTEPWFCEACKAGVTDPSCELCPNKGGIFKETEVGAWVHLVCALYVPGVAFSEVERLSGVTLFEMAYSRWGARSCALCEDTTLARTGVCVGCDAGLCKTFFHVTCGQREGLLAEAHTEEAEQADPFYAHCRLHSDKALVKKRKRNWLALQLRTEKRKLELQTNITTDEKLRIQRKLVKYRRKYLQQKENRNPPWVPTQKMARMLYSSASAMRKFARKAECMGIDTHALEFQDAQMAALKDVSRRWHVPPAFSVEFVGYYLERNSRVTSLRKSLERLTKENEKLLSEDENLRTEYDEASKENTDALAELTSTKQALQKIYDAIIALCPKKVAPPIMEEKPLIPPVIQRSTPKVTPYQLQKRESASRSMSVPTAAALKMGVGFPLSDNPDARHGKVLSTSLEATTGALAARECAVCGRSSERHLMAACDTCRHHYHLHCLRPPLQRPPKKSKLYGWYVLDTTTPSHPYIHSLPSTPAATTTTCTACARRCSARPRRASSTAGNAPSATRHPTPNQKFWRKKFRVDREYGTAKMAPSSPNRKAPSRSLLHRPNPIERPHKIEKVATTENMSPIKVTIKPFDFSSENEGSEFKKKDKKIKKSKQKEHASASAGEGESPSKKLKRSFTSPTLTNTPLMSITPIVADSPNDSHNENSNASTTLPPVKRDETVQNISFSSLLNDAKERDSKAIESSIESTLANLSSDIATYKANRKRRKEKHRSRYSPDLLRSPSKSHKHKRKKKCQDMENPEMPHPRITIKIKPIPKPDGSLDTQMFYVPTDSNDGPPPAMMKKMSKQVEQDVAKPPPPQPEVPLEPIAEGDTATPLAINPEENPVELTKPKVRNTPLPFGNKTKSSCTILLYQKFLLIVFVVSPHPVIAFGTDMGSYTYEEYADIMFCYGFSNGCATGAKREYVRRYPNRRAPHMRVFTDTYRRLRETGSVHARTPWDSGNTRIHGLDEEDEEEEQEMLDQFQPLPTAFVAVKPKSHGLTKLKRSRTSRARRTTGGETSSPAQAMTPLTHCDVCTQPGDNTNLVRCDECFKRYHFTCLEPPLNKNPKKRGYSWHCADCDPTDVEENN